MFQLAAQAAYAQRFNRDICLSRAFNPAFSIPYRICSEKEIQQARSKTCFYERFQKEVLTNKNCSSLAYFLQNERFFKDQEKLVRDLFIFSKPLPASAQKIANQMEQKNSVSIHIRRGDYIPSHYPIMTLDYYEKAADYIKEKTGKPVHLYVFSNDTGWVKNHFFSKHPFTIISGNSDTVDMHLMSLCKHNIVSASTFSWWGAWLNKNPNKIIIAPDQWLYEHPWWGDDIIPPEWHIMPAHDIRGGSIAVVYVSKDKSTQSWNDFREKAEKYFIPELPKIYFSFQNNHFPLGFTTFFRKTFKKYLLINYFQEKLKGFDYVYFLNSPLPNQYLRDKVPDNKYPFVFCSKSMHCYKTEEIRKSSDEYSVQIMPDVFENTLFIQKGFIGMTQKAFLSMMKTEDHYLKDMTFEMYENLSMYNILYVLKKSIPFIFHAFYFESE